MQISLRGRQVPPSPIRKLVPFADDAKARGVVVHHLNIGQPDIATPQVFFDHVATYREKVLAYGHSAGNAPLREAMAAYYRRLGHAVDAEHVTVTTGGSEAILFAMMAICDPGDEIVCFEPFYTNYNSYAVQAGITLRPVRCDAADGYHLPSRAVVEAAIGPRTRALLICSPNNPTGTVLTRDEMKMIADVARERGLYVVSDEAYREFAYGETPATSVLAFPELEERAVVLDSLSKRFSVCGARIGCLVSKSPELARAFLHLGQARLCSPSLEQHGAVALLGLDGAYFEELQGEYRRRRDAVMRGLATISGASASTPDGAFYVMARIDVDDAGKFAEWLLREFQHEGETVMVAPGDGFYATPGLGRDEIRIAYVLEIDRLERAMRCLREGLARYRTQHPRG
jgi:aspartate aminotransferase